jgi:cob(I)alamin adenosyltransferase
MVVLNRIYTRTGDAGETALGSGERVSKTHLRIDAYGTVDETNTIVGLVRLHTKHVRLQVLDEMLARVQNELFDLGADLCVPDRGQPFAFEPLRMVMSQATRLEQEIDLMNESLAPLRSFVLSGGCAAAAFLHQARTVCRRAERLMVALAAMDDEVVGEAALAYVNRLSDFLFVAGRFANIHDGDGDVLWVPGKTR